MKAINLTTGRPAKWPKQQPWKTGTDKAEFHCVWKGKWYRLASLSAHLKHNVPDGFNLLIDERWETVLAPREQIHIAHRI